MRKKEAMSNERLKCYRDLKNSLDKAEREGREEGREEGKHEKTLQILKKGFEKGFSIEVMAELADLSVEEVLAIKKEYEL